MHWLKHPIAAISGRLPASPAIRLNTNPLCSFTFDDCPYSALQNAGKILEEAGVAGTFFVSGSILLSRQAGDKRMLAPEDLVSLLNHGHELGCHSYSHRSFRGLPIEVIRRDLMDNRALLMSTPGAESLVSFAYPYGETRWRAKLEIVKQFGVARGVHEGVNGRLIDLSQLRAITITARGFSLAKFSRWVEIAKRRRGWIVFTTHDVRENPSDWGCTPHQFAQVLNLVRAAQIEILTIRNALGRVMHRGA